MPTNDKKMASRDKTYHDLREETKFFLEKQGKAMLDLAEKISDHGRPLNPEDKDLLRTALAVRVKRYSSVLQANFILGDIAEMERAADEIFAYVRLVDTND